MTRRLEEALLVAETTSGGGWIAHDGKGMPVDGNTLVWVKFDDGGDDTHNPSPKTAEWWQGGADSWSPEAWTKIAAYRIVESV